MLMQLTFGGLELRDVFAMSATIKDLEPYTTYHPYGTKLDIPKARYAFADDMIAARTNGMTNDADVSAKARLDALREARDIFLSPLPMNGHHSRIEALDDLISKVLPNGALAEV
jgi:hypothetical protein